MKVITQDTSFKGEFVKYYEKFFYFGKEKLISDTASYIDRIISSIYPGGEVDLWDIGCGTGIFEEVFSPMVRQIIATDISEDMIAYASSNHALQNVKYQIDNICNTNVENCFNVAVALSHVIGYQLSNEQLRGAFNSVRKQLVDGGYFLFNFYNAPALFLNSLESRSTMVRDGNVQIERESTAERLPMQNALRLHYEYSITENESNTRIVIDEKMRYFTYTELEYYLTGMGFEVTDCLSFLTMNPLSENEWNGFLVARKISR